LTRAQRLSLLEQLEKSLVDEEVVSLSPAVKRDLDRRLAELDRDRGGIPWKTFERELQRLMR
jgi:putative addiction module component (TIGR02574 family)